MIFYHFAEIKCFSKESNVDMCSSSCYCDPENAARPPSMSICRRAEENRKFSTFF